MAHVRTLRILYVIVKLKSHLKCYYPTTFYSILIPPGVCPWGLVEVLRDRSGGAGPGDDGDVVMVMVMLMVMLMVMVMVMVMVPDQGAISAWAKRRHLPSDSFTALCNMREVPLSALKSIFIL